MGDLYQKAFSGRAKRSQISGAIFTPRGYYQSSVTENGGTKSPISVQGLCRSCQKENHDAPGNGFSQAILSAYTTASIPKSAATRFLANACKAKSLAKARKALNCKQAQLLNRAQRKELAKQRLFKEQADRCPCCQKGKMIIIHVWLNNKDPPAYISGMVAS